MQQHIRIRGFASASATSAAARPPARARWRRWRLGCAIPGPRANLPHPSF